MKPWTMDREKKKECQLHLTPGTEEGCRRSVRFGDREEMRFVKWIERNRAHRIGHIVGLDRQLEDCRKMKTRIAVLEAVASGYEKKK